MEYSVVHKSDESDFTKYNYIGVFVSDVQQTVSINGRDVVLDPGFILPVKLRQNGTTTNNADLYFVGNDLSSVAGSPTLSL